MRDVMAQMEDLIERIEDAIWPRLEEYLREPDEFKRQMISEVLRFYQQAVEHRKKYEELESDLWNVDLDRF